MDEARKSAYKRVKNIQIPNMFYRTDIGVRWFTDSDRLQTWGYLCDNGTAAPYSTSVWSDRYPASGWSSIAGSVYNIQSEFSFASWEWA